MTEAQVWLRWAQFIDLALAFGVPFTAWLLGQRVMSGRGRAMLAAASLAGLALCGTCFLIMLAAMMGGGIGDLDQATVVMMACHSPLGWSVIARLAALTACLILALAVRRLATAPMAALAGVAAASLAWGGHGAASQGWAGMLRLGGDIAHLWCGLIWLGALFLFTARLWSVDHQDRGATAHLLRGLSAFALIGSILVGVLTVSGLANLLFLLPVSRWGQLAHTPYGWLILTKLLLFGLMFLLAAHNRFQLVPALERATMGDTRRHAVQALRRSISCETALALGVIWCVAWAGTLDPSGMMP